MIYHFIIGNPMKDRKYYSIRTGRLQNDEKLNLDFLRKLFVSTYESFEERGYFQERLGINCIDGYIPGTVGDVEIYSFRNEKRKSFLKKKYLT